MRTGQDTEEPSEPVASSCDGAPRTGAAKAAINESALEMLTRRIARLNMQAAALAACFPAVKGKG